MLYWPRPRVEAHRVKAVIVFTLLPIATGFGSAARSRVYEVSIVDCPNKDYPWMQDSVIMTTGFLPTITCDLEQMSRHPKVF